MFKVPAAVIPAALAGAGYSSIAWARGDFDHVMGSVLCAVIGTLLVLVLSTENS